MTDLELAANVALSVLKDIVYQEWIIKNPEEVQEAIRRLRKALNK